MSESMIEAQVPFGGFRGGQQLAKLESRNQEPGRGAAVGIKSSEYCLSQDAWDGMTWKTGTSGKGVGDELIGRGTDGANKETGKK